MSFVAVAVGGAGLVGSVVGGVIQGNAAKSAADKQSAAAADANNQQKAMYDQTRADQEQYRAAGGKALSAMADPSFQHTFGAEDFNKDPGYDFRMQEGQKALERGAAAKGGLMSGGAVKALDRYGQGFASNEYQNAYNRFTNDQSSRFGRLSAIAGMGQGANAANQSAGMNYSNNYGNNVSGAANAEGAADIAGGNAAAGALSNIGKMGTDLYAMKSGGGGGMPSGGSTTGSPLYGGGRTYGLFGRS